MVELLKQGQFLPFLLERQVMIIYAGGKGHLDDLPTADVGRFEREFFAFADKEYPEVAMDIAKTRDLTKETAERLEKALRRSRNGSRRAHKPMATLQDIKRRLRSVENTKQITAAMEMVSAAKLRRAQMRVTAAVRMPPSCPRSWKTWPAWHRVCRIHCSSRGRKRPSAS
jgi:hypothetical protein